MSIPHKRIGDRLKSVSLGVGPASATWDMPEAERLVAERVINFLEDRRVLYNPAAWELPKDCIESIFQIRQMLTEEIAKAGKGGKIGNVLAGMRAECRRFLDAINPGRGHGWGPQDFEFFLHLGQFRTAIGFYLAEISAAYKLDLPEELDEFLPSPS